MNKIKDRNFYLNTLSEGNIIAFNVDGNMYSGKVVSMDFGSIAVKTKNGSVYFIQKNDIAWVKNGTHWPQGIYNSLKFSNKRTRKE